MSPRLHGLVRLLAGAVFLILAASGGYAQQPAGTPPAPTARAQLEAGRLDLAQIEAALQRDNLDDRRLADLRARLEPILGMVEEIIAREQPRADETKARIEQFGPAPDASKGQSESADVAKDRAEQQRQWKEADETIRLAKALSLHLDQVRQSVADRRRANFARETLKRHASVASPVLWYDVAVNLPVDARAFRFLTTQWGEAILANLDWYEALLLLLAALGVLVLVPRIKRWVHTGKLTSIRTEQGERACEEDFEPPMLKRVYLAGRIVVFSAILPAVVLLIFFGLLDEFGLLPGRAEAVMEVVIGGLAGFVFVNGLAWAVLAPERPAWSLIGIENRLAITFYRLIRAIGLVILAGRVLEAFYSAIVASLPLSIATKGVIAVMMALLLMRGLRQAFGGTGSGNVEAASHGGLSLLPLRLFGWGVAILLLVSALLGYIPLAAFVAGQIVWLLILVLGGVIALNFVEEGVGAGLSSRGGIGRRISATTGLSASSLDQVSVLGAGLLRLLLFIVIGMLALAPWGLDSAGALGSLRAAFFGFQVGGVTISLSTIAIALAFFTVGFFITRAIQNWLDTRYLPHTGLDPGLRNSIRTIFGYIGIVLAAMVALSQLGLSLDKITIVAGALSVGIGFGLQSIVNNFVSGLILLWERPIKVGDWIVVGDEQGTVKHINVRATEIQTFDRASLIIPNSEFISGRVKNWVHADRTARIIIPVNVEYTAEPDAVQALLREAALAHREVMSEPGPVVVFKNLGESGLDFELRCFCDVDAMLMTRSELLFDIFARLKAAGIAIPYPTRRVEIAHVPAGPNASAMIVAEIQKGKL